MHMVALTWNNVFWIVFNFIEINCYWNFYSWPPIMTEFEICIWFGAMTSRFNCGCSFGSEVNITIHVTSWSPTSCHCQEDGQTLSGIAHNHEFTKFTCVLCWWPMHALRFKALWENPRLMNENNQWGSILTHATSPMSSHGLELCQFGLLTWGH